MMKWPILGGIFCGMIRAEARSKSRFKQCYYPHVEVADLLFHSIAKTLQLEAYGPAAKHEYYSWHLWHTTSFLPFSNSFPSWSLIWNSDHPRRLFLMALSAALHCEKVRFEWKISRKKRNWRKIRGNRTATERMSFECSAWQRILKTAFSRIVTVFKIYLY